MKSIVKPIKRGTVAELTKSTKLPVLASVMLTGAIAIAATGCSTEVKADGITIESLVVSGSAGESIESAVNASLDGKVLYQVGDAAPDQTAAVNDIPEDINKPTVAVDTVTPAPGQDTDTTVSVKDTDKDTVTPAPVVTEAVSVDSKSEDTQAKTGFAKIAEGTVYHFENNAGGFSLKGDFGTVDLYYSNDLLVYKLNGGNECRVDVSSTKCYCDAYLFRHNGKTFIYVETVRGCDNNDLNVYEVTDTSICRVGVLSGFAISGPTFTTTSSFKGYDDGGRYGHMVSERKFKVSANGMPVPADNYSSLSSAAIKAAKDLSGYIVKDGKVTSRQTTIKNGESVELVALNEVEYIDLKDASGNTVRVDFTEQCCEYYDMNDYRWIYRAIHSMVTPVYGREAIMYLKDGDVFEFNYGGGDWWTTSYYGSFMVETLYSVNAGQDVIRITYNEDTYDMPVGNAKDGLILTDAYLLDIGYKAFIYVDTCDANGYSTLYVFNIYENNCLDCGTCKGLSVLSMNSTTCFPCCEENASDSKLAGTRFFKVSENGMPIPADNHTEFDAFATLKATNDMTGVIVRDGIATSETKTIKAGDIVEPVELDEVDHIDFKDSEGNIVRVDFVPLLNEYYDMNDYHWMYKAVMTMVEPA